MRYQVNVKSTNRTHIAYMGMDKAMAKHTMGTARQSLEVGGGTADVEYYENETFRDGWRVCDGVSKMVRSEVAKP